MIDASGNQRCSFVHVSFSRPFFPRYRTVLTFSCLVSLLVVVVVLFDASCALACLACVSAVVRVVLVFPPSCPCFWFSVFISFRPSGLSCACFTGNVSTKCPILLDETPQSCYTQRRKWNSPLLSVRNALWIYTHDSDKQTMQPTENPKPPAVPKKEKGIRIPSRNCPQTNEQSRQIQSRHDCTYARDSQQQEKDSVLLPFSQEERNERIRIHILLPSSSSSTTRKATTTNILIVTRIQHANKVIPTFLSFC